MPRVPRAPRASLARILARLGAKEVARRLGASSAAVSRWATRGIPAKHADAVFTTVRRHEGSRKAARTRRVNLVFRQQAPTPPDPRGGKRWGAQPLTAEQATPKSAPRKPRDDAERTYPGGTEKAVETDNKIGVETWFDVGRSVLDVSPDELADLAIEWWDMSGRETVYARFLFLRYVPFNPAYKGNAFLESRQGAWLSRWASTHAHGAERSFRDEFVTRIEVAQGEADHTVIWLDKFQVVALDRKGGLDIREEAARRLRGEIA